MTISTTNRRNQYTLSGVGPYAYTFLILQQSHLAVYVNDVLQASGFTVTGVGSESGGEITFDTDPGAGTLTLIREVPFTQETDYITGDKFPAETHEDALDFARMVDLQILELLDRAAIGPPSSGGVFSFSIPAPDTAGFLLGVNADEDGWELIDPSSLEQAGILSTKGDLLTRDNLRNIRLPVGTNDQVLTADSTTASGLAWKDSPGGAGDDPAVSVFDFDDFVSGNHSIGTGSPQDITNKMGWHLDPATGSVNYNLLDAVPGRPGVVRLGNASTGASGVTLRLSRSIEAAFHTDDNFDCKFIVRLQTDAAADAQEFQFGIGPVDAANKIAFEVLRGAGETTWFAETSSGGSDTRTDTGASLNDWHLFRIRRSGSNVIFSVDGTDVATHSTNIPSIASTLYFTIFRSGTTQPEPEMDIDYASMLITGLSR